MKIKLIDYGYSIKPFRAHANDAGADVYIQKKVRIEPHTTMKIPLGFGLEIPIGYAAFVFPRSGMSTRGIVCELPPIDSGYTGEIHAIVSNLSDVAFEADAGTRIGQLVITPVVVADFVNDFGALRGNNGFGSTGE